MTDVILFEEPVDVVQFLRLELPGGNIGNKGTIRLSIPKKMIKRDRKGRKRR